MSKRIDIPMNLKEMELVRNAISTSQKLTDNSYDIKILIRLENILEERIEQLKDDEEHQSRLYVEDEDGYLKPTDEFREAYEENNGKD